MDKPDRASQIAAMTNTRLADMHPLAQRLAPAGFGATHRDGRLWLSYPDNCDTEVIPDEHLPGDDQIDTQARILETLARRRAIALAVIRNACQLSGYDVDASADGLWGLCSGGGTSVLPVGWTLTAALREGEPESVLAGYLRESGGYFVTKAVLDRAFAMDLAPPVASFPIVVPQETIPACIDPLPEITGSGDGDDAAIDSWCKRQLDRLRARLKRPYFPYTSQFGPLWYDGENDWISRSELVECAHASGQASAYPGHALEFLLRLGCEEYRPAALHAWDRWIRDCAADADAMGFDELAAPLYRERADAREMIHAMDNYHVRRAVRAGQYNALHIVRADFLTNLAAFHRSVGDAERWGAFLDLVMHLVWEGVSLMPLFLDADELESLHALSLTMARRPPAEDAWLFVNHTLSLAAAFGWTDVAECFVALPQWRVAILGDDTPRNFFSAIPAGCLALSSLCPQIAGDAIVKPAFLKHQNRPVKRKDDESGDPIAVAWWRCRAARLMNSPRGHVGI
ncbi:MAG TPA: hypothetical protein VN017_07880 [Pseudoxanthomonas sp.]|nr:hypothetical protein [Pseudoxanthomonas sp.]